MDKIVAFCKRRGFVYQSSEIYGGIRSSYDYGPLGVELKRNIKEEWWRRMVHMREDMVGLDSAIIMHPKVWEASGHTATFNDMLVESRTSKRRYRADHLVEDATGIEAEGLDPEELTRIIQEDERVKDPVDGGRDFTPVRPFNLMFETYMGPVKGPENVAYLRPETAQGIFVNFKNVLQTSRVKVPFGIAQIGRSFRNEITPGNFIFRTREFEQMEMEFFVVPGTDEEWHQYWIDERTKWYVDLGIRFEFAGSEWGELEGVANRTDFDLTTHSKHSGQDLSYFDQAKNERFTPYVIEPAAGLSRSLMTFLVDAYGEDEAPNTKGGVDKRTVLRLDPRLSPVKVAVLPLSRNSDLTPKAKDLAAELRQHWNVEFDDAGAIGRRYRRQDEIGTPFCLTVDFDTLNDQAVTIRERDSMAQERIGLDQVESYLAARLPGC